MDVAVENHVPRCFGDEDRVAGDKGKTAELRIGISNDPGVLLLPTPVNSGTAGMKILYADGTPLGKTDVVLFEIIQRDRECFFRGDQGVLPLHIHGEWT